MKFATLAIRAGQDPDPSTGAVSVPIYQTSTYAQEGLGKHKGFEYARTQNPTRLALEKNLAALEGGRAAFAFASGMAAIKQMQIALEGGADGTYDPLVVKSEFITDENIDSYKPAAEREYTLEEVGRRLGITRERARQIEAKALQKMRAAKNRAA